MTDSHRQPLLNKEGYEGPSAPPATAAPSAPHRDDESAVGYPVASYPAAGPSHSGAVYPEVPAAGASYQPYAAPQPPILVPATHVVVCRHDHHHCHPERAACGSCHRVVVPEPHKESGLCACITAVGLVGSGCCILAWLPFCCNVTKDTVYRCPDCQAEITRRRAPFE